mmetsp:Transcript_6765/g.22458  ORF Transcript_6765/g.22458 Transcript_6765/m.22458 type:complete len:164 (+) Transcript_6765:3-494(+)
MALRVTACSVASRRASASAGARRASAGVARSVASEPSSPAAAAGGLTPVSAETALSLHAGDTSLTVPFSHAAALELDAALTELLDCFREKEAGPQKRRLPMMEFELRGESAAGLVGLEVLCNPNGAANWVSARALVRLTFGDVEVTTEGLVSAIKSDLDNFMR